MRKLSPFKAIAHAFNSIRNYPQVAFRIGRVWVPVMLVAGFLDAYAGPPDTQSQDMTGREWIQVLTGVLSLIAVCSMAVNWHRFILRDELGPSLRLDSAVFRYAGNTVLIMMAMLVPAVMVLAAVMLLPPAGAIIGLPLVVLSGGVVTRLSIKLPAVALGNGTFSFRDAWTASEGNFWPCAGVFLLNAAIFLGILLVLTLAVAMLNAVSLPLSLAFQVVAAALLQLFYAIFNASIFTSLYGFFVERRDF
ncbi:hypothetical protein [Aestuariivirga sp.]|uniref:hypothetical protein n=1 Tax=Aestuariivirga sp. TaxID=2650926 RepID=UPI00391DEFD1